MKNTKHGIIEQYYIEQIQIGKASAHQQLPSENEIAEQFEVSRHTVRQALNFLVQDGWIYKERGVGSFFAEKKSVEQQKNVAVLTTYISDYIFPKIIEGIEQELRKKDYNLLLFNSNNDIEIEKTCLERIVNQNILGVIVEPAQSAVNLLDSEFIKQFKEKGIKYIAINSYYKNYNSSFVLVNDEQGGYKITNYLLNLGHKRIAGIFKIDDVQGERRRDGYKKALLEQDIEVAYELIGEYVTVNQSVYIAEFARHILSMENRPSAIVCYNDKIALKVIEYCKNEGMRVPEDVSVVSFDDSALATSSDVKLTTIQHPKKDMGIRATKCMIDMIEGRITSPQYTYEAELIVRESCVSKIE